MGRANKPYGFEVWECWADALGWPPSAKRDMAWWMYREVFTGIRMMVKFEDLDNDDDWYEDLLRRHDIARGLGLKTLLCIDWFNRASDAGGYHSKLHRPRLEDIPGKVASIIMDFSPTMIEVCNEPYYAKRLVDRVNHKEYRDFVQAYVDGAADANFDGKIVASQPNEKFTKRSPNGLHDAWVWDVHWRNGFIEGDHSAVLHECGDIDCLTGRVDDWINGKPIGYQYVHFETEFSACGRATLATDPHAEIITRQFTQWAKSKKLPFTWLDMGGYVPGGGWNMDTRLIDNSGNLTYAAKGLLSAMGIEPPNNAPPPVPSPPGEPGATWFYRAVRRAGQLPNVKEAGRDRRFNKYVRKFKESV